MVDPHHQPTAEHCHWVSRRTAAVELIHFQRPDQSAVAGSTTVQPAATKTVWLFPLERPNPADLVAVALTATALLKRVGGEVGTQGGRGRQPTIRGCRCS
jgi:hypothetical protein